MIITKNVKLKWSRRGIKHYTNKGYIFTKINDEFIVKTEDLNKSDKTKIEVICDNENCDNRIIKTIQYSNYAKYIEGNNGKYYCRKCANQLIGVPNRIKNQIKSGDNFGNFLIKKYGKDGINKYWSDLNKDTPFDFTPSSNEKVFIKCPDNLNHPDYEMGCNSFKSGQRCPYCSNVKVTKEESLGAYLKHNNLSHLYSKENEKSAFEFSLKSNKKAKWKCHEGIHDDYIKTISSATMSNYLCPNCALSLGEKRIISYLKFKNIKFEQQVRYDDLRGVNNGLLSYDFYLPNYNLLIEFQGEQHKRFKKHLQGDIKNFEKQQEHDKRKREYAKNNNIKLLEIWYDEFDNIENILNNLINKE
jgi:very-short-patch-repair endonuclease